MDYEDQKGPTSQQKREAKNTVKQFLSRIPPELSLSGLSLTSIPSAKQVSKCEDNLLRLRLDHNLLAELPKGFAKLERLVLLNISWNRFLEFPNLAFAFDQLVRLDLSYNKIRILPREIENFVKLKEIKVHNNHLIALPSTIGRLKNLQLLYAQNNNISTIPMTLGKLSKLIKLDISGNKLSSLPITLGRLLSLKLFRWHHNHLQWPLNDFGKSTWTHPRAISYFLWRFLDGQAPNSSKPSKYDTVILDHLFYAAGHVKLEEEEMRVLQKFVSENCILEPVEGAKPIKRPNSVIAKYRQRIREALVVVPHPVLKVSAAEKKTFFEHQLAASKKFEKHFNKASLSKLEPAEQILKTNPVLDQVLKSLHNPWAYGYLHKEGSVTSTKTLTRLVRTSSKRSIDHHFKSQMDDDQDDSGKVEGSGKYAKRWCVLTSNHLLYFNKQGDKLPTGSINLIGKDGFRVSPFSDEEGEISRIEFGFSIVTKERIFRFGAPTDDDRIQWIKGLKKISSVLDKTTALLEFIKKSDVDAVVKSTPVLTQIFADVEAREDISVMTLDDGDNGRETTSSS